MTSLANILRLAAHALSRAQGRMGEYVRRFNGRLGKAEGIVAGAHKLARILWHLFKYREAFNPEVFSQEEKKIKSRKLARLHHTAAALGLKLIPAQ